MRLIRKLVLPLCLFAASPVLATSELGVALSADVVTFSYGHTSANKGTRWGVMGLYNDPERASLVAAHFNVVGQAGASSDVYTGLGFKAAVYDTFETASSLGLGGSVAYEPEVWSGFGVDGQLYYAPSILNTKDVDKYFDLVVRLTYAVNNQAKVFAGWQHIEIGYEGTSEDFDIDKSVNVGFALQF